MNNLKQVLSASIVAAALILPASSLYAAGSHDHSHGDAAMAFEPVSNEFGMYQPDMKATRTVEVGMSDAMEFTPAVVKIKKGDVVVFKNTNHGKLMHEFVLGTPESLAEHAEMMKKFPGMEHDEPYMAHVAPGESGTITWRFTEAGEFGFACLVPGHFDAGMKGKIIVES